CARVEPDVHEAVALLHGVAARAHSLRRAREPGHLDQAAAAVEAPAVEGTADAVALDLPADAEVRAEVRAVRVEHAGGAVLPAERDELAAEVAERLHVARREVGGEAEAVPAVGRRGEGIAAGHGLFSDLRSPAARCAPPAAAC